MVHLTKDELNSLLATAKAYNERDYLMILVAFNHGLRASEVCGMKCSQIKDGYITVQRLKGSLKTHQPLVRSTNPLFDELQLEVRAKAIGTGLMFPVSRVWFWKRMQKYCLLAGIPQHKAHPHALKHTIAALNIRQAGIENIRQYLGHKSIASTGEYLKVNDEEAATAVATAMGF